MKKGFTLMELLVYMAIVGIIVVVAGQAFSDSTKFRVRTQNMLKATQEAENAATLFKSDVSQMGTKNSKEASANGGDDTFVDANKKKWVYIHLKDPANPDDDTEDDYSSYSLSTSNGFDNLTFRRFRYDADGKYVAAEEINWFVENHVLKRSCRTLDGTPDDNLCKKESAENAKSHAVNIATDVVIFRVTPALPGIASTEVAQVFPACATLPCPSEYRMVARTDETDYAGLTIEPDATDHKFVRLSNFATNYSKKDNAVNTSSNRVNQVFLTGNVEPSGSGWATDCTPITLLKDAEYELSFSMPNNADEMRMFVPGRDHMSVGFRYKNNGSRPASLDDFLFFPPSHDNGTGARKMRFSVPTDIQNVCMAFTFSSYSPIAAQGSITIADLVLRKISTSNYTFEYPAGKSKTSLSLADKMNVKAFMLELRIKRGGTADGSGETGEATIRIPTPSNGVAD